MSQDLETGTSIKLIKPAPSIFSFDCKCSYNNNRGKNIFLREER